MLDDLKDFVIRTLSVQQNGIHLALHGRVGELRTGTAGSVHNRLPSVLEWLYSHSWVLYLNAVVLGGTTILAILTRLKLIP